MVRGSQDNSQRKTLAANPTPETEELRASQVPDGRQKSKEPQIDGRKWYTSGFLLILI